MILLWLLKKLDQTLNNTEVLLLVMLLNEQITQIRQLKIHSHNSLRTANLKMNKMYYGCLNYKYALHVALILKYLYVLSTQTPRGSSCEVTEENWQVCVSRQMGEKSH